MVAVKTEAVALSVRTRTWEAPLAAAPGQGTLPGRYRLTNRYVEVNGVPTIPITGELHYSRVPRTRWVERLRQMHAGGVTVVACYIFWNHHAEQGPQPSFSGNLDVAAFVEACEQVGLDVILRIGPWCHGEARHGGLPDWVLESCPATRTDDATYLSLVGDWFRALAGQLRDHLGPESRVVGLQLENELYDNPDHIVTLKKLALACGLSAPVWTATAWGSAELPAAEVLPLYGGYGDGFWVDADARWDDTFRAHYFFSHTWDDPGIGADLRAASGPAALPARPYDPAYPIATCELAGGMATAYHRRPWPDHLDVAAIAHAKLGSGSAWQGYYMYAGGANPPSAAGLQESHATGYPNDLERLGYDFHAVIGQAGTLRTSHAELRLQHAFVAAFRDLLTGSPSSLPDDLPAGVNDAQTLRWAWRGTERGGFVFVGWHQPHEPLPTHRDARFRVDLGEHRVTFPPHPVDIPPGTLARWPVALTLAQVTIRWATASALTLLPAGKHRPTTLVLLAEQGITPRLGLNPHVRVEGDLDEEEDNGTERVYRLERVLDTAVRLHADGHALDLLVLPAALRHQLWVLPTAHGRALLRSRDRLTLDGRGQISVRSSEPAPGVEVFHPDEGVWVKPVLRHEAGRASVSEATVTLGRRPPRRPPVSYGRRNTRESAPDTAAVEELAYRFDVRLPGSYAVGQEATVEVEWSGDVAVVVVGGRVVADRFWDGSVWELDAVDLGLGDGFEVWIVPLRPDAAVWVPEAAQRRRQASAADLVELTSVRVRSYATWTVAG